MVISRWCRSRHPGLSIPNFPSTRPRWKYNEETILKELSDYISGTYNQHYSAGDDSVQTLDLIEAVVTVNHSVDPTSSSTSRYDKKGTTT